MRVLHISDLHTGISKDKKIRGFEHDKDYHINSKVKSKPDLVKKERAQILKNEIVIFKKRIERIIKKQLIDLVVVSGDISVTGKSEQFENLTKLFKIFLEKKIPIQIVTGNHDLDYNYTKKGEEENKFLHYDEFIKKNIDIEGNRVFYDFSNDFSWFLAPSIELVFIGLNSCSFINHIQEHNVQLDLEYLYKIEEILKENELLRENYYKIPKVLISHFGWEWLKNGIGVKEQHRSTYWKFLGIFCGLYSKGKNRCKFT